MSGYFSIHCVAKAARRERARSLPHAPRRPLRRAELLGRDDQQLSRRRNPSPVHPLLDCNVGLSAALTRTEQYRVKAKECAERAEHAGDPETKRQLKDLARQWLDLAKYADKDGGS